MVHIITYRTMDVNQTKKQLPCTTRKGILKIMYNTDVKGLLEIMRIMQGGKTQAEYARSIGVTPQYLCDVYKQRREPGPAILSSMGATRSYLVPETFTSSIGGSNASKEGSQKASNKKPKEVSSKKRKSRR